MPRNYLQIVQLFDRVGTTCPICRELPAGDDIDWLSEGANHLLREHGWDVLHVGQTTGFDDGQLRTHATTAANWHQP
jgi:hypothetical protein